MHSMEYAVPFRWVAGRRGGRASAGGGGAEAVPVRDVGNRHFVAVSVDVAVRASNDVEAVLVQEGFLLLFDAVARLVGEGRPTVSSGFAPGLGDDEGAPVVYLKEPVLLLRPLARFQRLHQNSGLGRRCGYLGWELDPILNSGLNFSKENWDRLTFAFEFKASWSDGDNLPLLALLLLGNQKVSLLLRLF